MPATDHIILLLHLLVFVYWLGGDIGVFYASFLLTDSKREAAGRIAAAKILNDVDLVPRICLLLTLPTGLAVAASRGWLSVSFAFVVAAFVIAFVWIFLVLALHNQIGAVAILRRIDTISRWLFCLALVALSIAGVAGAVDVPLFISVKMALLAFAISMGLFVRKALTPFGPAFAKLATSEVDAAANETIRTCLDRARPAVVAIWIALIAAAMLGITTPV